MVVCVFIVSMKEQLRGALCTVKKVIDGSCLDRLQIQSLLIKVCRAVLV